MIKVYITKKKEVKSFQKETNSITLSSSLPSLGFSHASTSLCHTEPRFCQLVYNVTSAWHCAPERKEFAVLSWTLSMAAIIFTSFSSDGLEIKKWPSLRTGKTFDLPRNIRVSCIPRKEMSSLSLMNMPISKDSPAHHWATQITPKPLVPHIAAIEFLPICLRFAVWDNQSPAPCTHWSPTSTVICPFLNDYLLKYRWYTIVYQFQCTTYWFDIYIPYKMITISPVTICPHTKLIW